MQIPKKLSHFNVFLDGQSYAGIATQVELPTLEMKTEAYRSGGMDGPIPIEMGFDSELELSFTLGEYYRDVLTRFGYKNSGPLELAFRGNQKLHGTNIGYSVLVRGYLTTIEHGTAQSGENTEMNCTMKLTYLRIEQAGRELVEIDLLNLVRRIGGEDQLAAVRANLLL